MIQYPRTLNNNTYHSNKQEPPSFFHSDTNTWPQSGPFRWKHPWFGCNSRTDLDVVLEYIFFNLVPTSNRSLRFTRFRRSYVSCTDVVLTNHCQSYTVFLLDVRCSKWPWSFFCSCFFPMIVHLRCWAHLLLECCELQGRLADKQMSNSYKYIKFNSWS